MREQGEGIVLPMGYGKTANCRCVTHATKPQHLQNLTKCATVSIAGCGSSIPSNADLSNLHWHPALIPPQQAPQNVDLSIGPLGCFCKHFVKYYAFVQKCS